MRLPLFGVVFDGAARLLVSHLSAVALSGGGGRLVASVQEAGRGVSRRGLCGFVACRWKIWPPPVRWCGAGPRSGAVRAWGVPPAVASSSSSDPAPRSWWLLRLFNASGLGVLLLPRWVFQAAGSFGVSDGGGLARPVTSRLKMECASFAVLCFLSVFSLLVLGSVLCFFPFEYK